ncbi:MAG TPA: DMT family transporter [Marinobacter sp.]|uniref:DMT family transporter n=2 Tax=root TaxID=1 RepID=A0A831R6L7_9GAMM|nr:DMT family transporter [Marinobacter antarcticus]HDZ36711.1 DMT family transporter [Marinobacter sp.]HEA53124.1 DMT family transporter [Marinobacter antarcticus]
MATVSSQALSPKTIVGMVIVAILWAICFPFISVGLPDAPPLLFASLRALLAGLCLVVIGMKMGRRFHCSLRRLGMLALIGFSYTGMGLGGMFLGAGNVGPGIATVLANAQPLFAAVLSIFVLREAITARVALGLLIGFVGVIVLALPEFDFGTDRFVGTLYVLGGAVGTAIGNVLLKLQADEGDGYWPMGIQLILGAIFLFFASLLADEGFEVDWTWSFASAVFILAVPATALMVSLWYWLLARAPLIKLNPFTFLTPAFGLLIGALFFDETFSVVELAGIAITIVGLIVIVVVPSRKKRIA